MPNRLICSGEVNIEEDMAAVRIEDVSFAYGFSEGTENIDSTQISESDRALQNINLNIGVGEYVAILGHNGSGKSTLAKLISALEVPTEGNIFILGNNTRDEQGFEAIRRVTACVFQNPDNQIVGATIEEDVAFGPENLGIPNPELRATVDECLKQVGLYEFRLREASRLSGGQKQKLAIAGALAMKPRILILDEATSMLDPLARDEFLELAERLKREQKLTLITITHDMNEAMRADRIIVMDSGRILMQGKPEEVFCNEPKLTSIGLELPQHIRIANKLAQVTNTEVPNSVIGKIDTTIDFIRSTAAKYHEEVKFNVPEVKPLSHKNILWVENLVYSYDNRMAPVLDDISFEVEEGEILAIIGKSGCGKTTLISHLNAVIKSTSGVVKVATAEGDILRTNNRRDIKRIRENVGLVFQYPEYQLFEETVYKDIEFGLKKQGKSEEERRKAILETIKLVGLKESILEKNPFELSGGQKRRVAIAGVLAMNPRILVLDEPAAGLDPKSKNDMFEIIRNLKQHGVTIIIVSHNMDDVIKYSDRVLILSNGKTLKARRSDRSFDDTELLNELGIRRPLIHTLTEKVISKDDPQIRTQIAEVRNSEDSVKLILKEVPKT